jgi:hypothetical protein
MLFRSGGLNALDNTGFFDDILDIYCRARGNVKEIRVFYPESSDEYIFLGRYNRNYKITNMSFMIYFTVGQKTFDIYYEYHGNSGMELKVYSNDYLIGSMSFNILHNDNVIVGIQDVQESILYDFIVEPEGRYLYYLLPFASFEKGKWWYDYLVYDENSWECKISGLNDKSKLIRIKKVKIQNLQIYSIINTIDNTEMNLKLLFNDIGDLLEISYDDAGQIIDKINYIYLDYDAEGNWIECIEQYDGDFARKIIRQFVYY